MKETKHKSLQCEIYDQLASMSCARIRKKCGIISFTNEVYEAFVVFHENSLMELSIKEKKTGDTPFYLHFEAREPRSARDNFQAFFDFFKDKTPASGFRFRRLQVRTIRRLQKSAWMWTRPKTVLP